MNCGDIIACLDSIRTYCVEQRRGFHAEVLALRALHMREAKFGSDHPNVATGLILLAQTYLSEWKLAEALALYERALSIQEKTLGVDHLDIAETLNYMANVQQNPKVRLELRQRALRIRENALGCEHPDVATSTGELAGAYQELDEPEKAEEYFLKAIAIFEKTLGPDHQDTAMSLKNLDRVLPIACCTNQSRGVVPTVYKGTGESRGARRQESRGGCLP